MSLVSYEIARERVLAAVAPIDGVERMPLGSAEGRVMAERVHAVEPNPRFDNSALDGYCVSCAADAQLGASLKVVGEAAAGGVVSVFDHGEALRVFTGGPLPANAYGVAYQERCRRDGESVILEEEVEAGEGVRKLGADYCVGDALAETGDVVNAGCLALAASQGGGITANVFRKPRVAVLVTGNELSDNPCPYEIYDSNSPMLRKLTEACGCDVSLRSAKDNDELITATIVELTKTHDAIIVSGGASVGDYDYLPRIIERRGEVLVHGVSIKPGRPFLFGRVNQTPIFCLPGNPASAFVTFGILVRPALEKIDGKRPISRTVLVHLDGDIEQGNRDEWIRCRISGEHTAEPVAVQGSFGIKSLAAAELLVRVPANTEHKSGDLRSAILLH